MIARIIVFPKLGEREDWGEYEFVALPTTGERLSATREGALHHLRILEIFHISHNPQAGDPAAEVRIIAAPRRP